MVSIAIAMFLSQTVFRLLRFVEQGPVILCHAWAKTLQSQLLERRWSPTHSGAGGPGSKRPKECQNDPKIIRRDLLLRRCRTRFRNQLRSNQSGQSAQPSVFSVHNAGNCQYSNSRNVPGASCSTEKRWCVLVYVPAADATRDDVHAFTQLLQLLQRFELLRWRRFFEHHVCAVAKRMQWPSSIAVFESATSEAQVQLRKTSLLHRWRLRRSTSCQRMHNLWRVTRINSEHKSLKQVSGS